MWGAPLVEVDKWKPPQRHESDNQQGGAMRPLIYFHDYQIQTALWLSRVYFNDEGMTNS